MVEAIGPKAVESRLRAAPAAAPVNPIAAAVPPRANETAPLPGSVARELAAKPPVDAERVARIKKAVAEGTFPITPARIADRLIALKLEWNMHEPA